MSARPSRAQGRATQFAWVPLRVSQCGALTVKRTAASRNQSNSTCFRRCSRTGVAMCPQLESTASARPKSRRIGKSPTETTPSGSADSSVRIRRGRPSENALVAVAITGRRRDLLRLAGLAFMLLTGARSVADHRLGAERRGVNVVQATADHHVDGEGCQHQLVESTAHEGFPAKGG